MKYIKDLGVLFRCEENTVIRKGLILMNMDSCDRFEKTELPPIQKSYSFLNQGAISESCFGSME
jgi:hypothetical protein